MKHRVAIVQREIVWGDVQRNLDIVEQRIKGVVADTIVLSEMFQTGFMTSEVVAEPMGGATTAWMRRMAAMCDAAIVGTVAISEGGKLYNRMLFVKPSGEVEYYDKHHLFTAGGERRLFTSGCERRVVEWRGVRFLLEVCYDLRFPVWSRQRGDYDAIIYSALWPSPRREVWRTLLRARAIENQCYVVGVNRIGCEPQLSYSGDSAVIDFFGRTMVDMADADDVVIVELDVEQRQSAIERFNTMDDADTFTIIQ